MLKNALTSQSVNTKDINVLEELNKRNSTSDSIEQHFSTAPEIVIPTERKTSTQKEYPLIKTGLSLDFTQFPRLKWNRTGIVQLTNRKFALKEEQMIVLLAVKNWGFCDTRMIYSNKLRLA